MPIETFQINYKKESPIVVEDLANQIDPLVHSDPKIPEYNPFRIQNIQNYNPIYSRFFELNETNYQKITLNQKYGIRDKHLVNRTTGEILERPIYFKFAPLLDPIRYMVGKYDLKDASLKILPTISNSGVCFPKIADSNNVSYIDTFFSYLGSQLLHTHNVFHSVDFYGSYLGVQELFRVNATDELEYLQTSPFFTEHLNRDFFVDCPEFAEYMREYMNVGSKSNRERIKYSSRSSNISLGAEELADTPENIHGGEGSGENDKETVYEKADRGSRRSDISSDNSETSRMSQNSRDLNYTSSDEEEEEADDDAAAEDNDEEHDWSSDSEEGSNKGSDKESDEQEEVYGYIKDFPTQMICLEECKGTLDSLLVDNKLDVQHAASCLFQIIMTLIIYDKAFHFSHNDLHTNNIMYVDTDIKYLYYCYESKYYRVPTYGRIFKIIDFGRSIYRFQGKLFCSDSFAKCGDAYSQYNCEPFMNENKPRIDPNPSFDLSRLACSMYDFIIPEDVKANRPENELCETILRWCTDDNGKQILYKRNGEERYPGFKLYKMISRNVHAHTPQAQLRYPYFSQFEISAKKLQKYGVDEILAHGINIDEIPSYVSATTDETP